jgi:hypothetical protein
MSETTWYWPRWAPYVLWFRHKCPHCNSVEFKPAESRPSDGLLNLLALRPVRCMYCWRRYYWLSLRGANAK